MTHRGAGSEAGIDAICREPPPHRVKIKFTQLFGLCFSGAGVQRACGGHHSARPGARGGPRLRDALCIFTGRGCGGITSRPVPWRVLCAQAPSRHRALPMSGSQQQMFL